MVGGRKRKAVIILIVLIAVVSAALVVWAILSRPARQVLTEEEVRQFITKHSSIMHLEVKPETIEFLSLELMAVEESPLMAAANKTIVYEDGEEIDYLETLPDKVWVIKYECEGRVWGPAGTHPPQFTRQFVQVIMDAYTRSIINVLAHAVDDE